ncbi:putative zinc-type alcohol dehydrogenase-like protein AdhB [Colletotrichum siamense]|nr:putative zinc-type alcohol dehydrogenase-like protein AdhB [Colletotrichum siamense]
MGHEAIGYISELGSAVSGLEVGDYVIIPDTVNHGRLEMEPTALDFYGNGAVVTDGLQSEYARVRFADSNLIPIPLTHETTSITIEQDCLTISDIFATGWASLDFSGFKTGDTVAVFGAGPVGLLAAYSAVLRDASKVGKASPHFVASASIPIEDVPAYYARFNAHDEIKVFIHFP